MKKSSTFCKKGVPFCMRIGYDDHMIANMAFEVKKAAFAEVE